MKKAPSRKIHNTASELFNEAPPLFRLPDSVALLCSNRSNLPAPELLKVSSSPNSHETILTLKIPDIGRRVNCYLLKSDLPSDMYYNVVPGVYMFTIYTQNLEDDAVFTLLYCSGTLVSKKTTVKILKGKPNE